MRFTTLRTLRALRLKFYSIFVGITGFWNVPAACEIITSSYYNICVYLRLSAVEMKKLTADARGWTQMRFALVFLVSLRAVF